MGPSLYVIKSCDMFCIELQRAGIFSSHTGVTGLNVVSNPQHFNKGWSDHSVVPTLWFSSYSTCSLYRVAKLHFTTLQVISKTNCYTNRISFRSWQINGWTLKEGLYSSSRPTKLHEEIFSGRIQDTWLWVYQAETFLLFILSHIRKHKVFFPLLSFAPG